MALTKVQKELWANGMIALYETASIGERICNTNLIQDTQADKWHIPAASDVDVADVDDSSDITYDDLTDTVTEVTPNFDKKFSVIDYDTNKVQTSIDYAPTYSPWWLQTHQRAGRSYSVCSRRCWIEL